MQKEDSGRRQDQRVGGIRAARQQHGDDDEKGGERQDGQRAEPARGRLVPRLFGAEQRQVAGPMVVWGIVEEEPPAAAEEAALGILRDEIRGGLKEDLWVFSSAARIQSVMSILFLG